MKKQPFSWRGRFYNHKRERIIHRMHSIGQTAVQFITSKLRYKNPFFKNNDSQSVLAQWLVKNAPIKSSSQPIITWLGHASFLIQVDNKNILIDPVFYSISKLFKRMIPMPLAISDLPTIDIILLSHNHADHCDPKSLKHFIDNDPLVLVPQGDKTFISSLGFKAVHEMGWWDERIIDELGIHFLPADHWAGMFNPFSVNTSLWGSWLIKNKHQTIYCAGDTAYNDHFKQIGNYFDIDVALMPIGPNEPKKIQLFSHVSAEQSVQAFLDLKAQHFIPMHWGTFDSGWDTFELPINLLKHAWHQQRESLIDKQLTIVKFGQQFLT